MKSINILKVALLSIALATLPLTATAETSEVTFARQYGIAYLPLMVLEHEKLVQKHAAQDGLGSVNAKFVQLGGTSSMYDALLSGSIQFGAAAAPGIAILWDKTRGTPQEVRAFASISSIPMLLNCRDPRIKTIKDITSNDQITMNAVKVSVYATVLQMAAAQIWGIENYNKLDARTVALPHPDGLAALLSEGVACQFTGPPYAEEALRHPPIHTVLNAKDVLGTPHASSVMLMTTASFRKANPKTYAAVWSAYQEAMDLINKDREKAASIYLAMSKSKETHKQVMELLDDPDIVFSPIPYGTMAYLRFMSETGRIKTKPESWKDLFFEEARQFPGS